MWEMKPDGDGTQQDTFWERNRLNFDTKEHDHFFFSSQVVFSDSFGIMLLVQGGSFPLYIPFCTVCLIIPWPFPDVSCQIMVMPLWKHFI